MSKPEWKDGPSWAKFLAQDGNGDWCFFRDEPISGLHHWLPRSTPTQGDAFEYADENMAGIGSPNANWKLTLEPRP